VCHVSISKYGHVAGFKRLGMSPIDSLYHGSIRFLLAQFMVVQCCAVLWNFEMVVDLSIKQDFAKGDFQTFGYGANA
jgi:hypothetical protein